jgi:hypothetical protein
MMDRGGRIARAAFPSASMIAAKRSPEWVILRCLLRSHDVILGSKEGIGMGGHHLILGKLTDFLTGEVLDDTLDERYRQNIARMLVERKGYGRQDVEPRRELLLQADKRRAVIRIDFVVRVAGKAGMIIRFGPGSIVSRERPALAVSRLVEAYQVPVAVATNGEDAEVLDGESGKVVGRGLEALPSKAELEERVRHYPFPAISPERALLESRVAYCYEVDDACPCDDTICRLS